MNKNQPSGTFANNIYLVTRGRPADDGYEVFGAFTERDKAEKFADIKSEDSERDSWRVEVFVANKPGIDKPMCRIYSFRYTADFEVDSCCLNTERDYYCAYIDRDYYYPTVRPIIETSYESSGIYSAIKCHCIDTIKAYAFDVLADDESSARKIAQDKMTKYKLKKNDNYN